MAQSMAPLPITGRCYCGRSRILATEAPTAIAYCHCADCRRVTGAPVAVFCEFDANALTFSPNEGLTVSTSPGVTRTFCESCGSPLSGQYSYLPGKIYVAIGLLDQAADLQPDLHAHSGEALPWLCIQDDLNRHEGSARSHLGD